MEIKSLLNKNLAAKPETQRMSRKMPAVDFSKLRHMGFNENVFGMSPKAIEAGKAAIEPSNLYMFFDFSKTALKPTLAEEYGVETSWIATGGGSSSIIDALGRCFLNNDDEVVVCMPTFSAFVDMAQNMGAKPVIVPLTADYKFDLDGMLAAVTDKTKMMVICNPNNPTGTYLSESELKAFAEKVPENIVVVFDEAYMEFAEAPDCVSMLETMKTTPNKPFVILKTFSKFYAMAGARLGYAIAQPELIAELSKCSIGFDVSKATSDAAAAAVRDKEHGKYVLEQVFKWRAYLTKEMKALGCKVVESQTNFIYFDAGIDPKELMMFMMEKGILISAAELSRVSVGLPEDNVYFIECLKEAMGK